MTDENFLHGTGRRIENASEGIEKKAETAGALNAYIYLIMDAQLNIQNGTYVSAIYKTKNVYERTAYCIVRSSNWSRKNTPSIGFTRE